MSSYTSSPPHPTPLSFYYCFSSTLYYFSSLFRVHAHIHKESIDSYEIRKVGYGSVPPARVVVFDNGELNGEVYFEVDPDHLDYMIAATSTATAVAVADSNNNNDDDDDDAEWDDDDDDSNNPTTPMIPQLFVEIYATTNSDNDDDDSYCDTTTSTLIDTDMGVDFSFYTYQFDNDEYTSLFEPQTQDECFPRTIDGVVTAVDFNFTDVFYEEPTSMTILDPMYYQDTSIDNGLLQFCV